MHDHLYGKILHRRFEKGLIKEAVQKGSETSSTQGKVQEKTEVRNEFKFKYNKTKASSLF